MKQQLEQLLKDAEEVTAKMREALAHMDKSAINMEHGKWYRVKANFDWLIKFDRIENGRVYNLYSLRLDIKQAGCCTHGLFIGNIESFSPATPEDMQLLPDGHPEKQWTPKKGDWAEVVEGTFRFDIGDIIQIDEDGSLIPFCILHNGERRAISSHKLRHLPNYKPKPALAVTYEEVAEAVKPLFLVAVNDGEILEVTYDPYQLPTESAAKQDRAYIQIKNLEAYCTGKFEGERDYTLFVNCDMNLRYEEVDYAPFHFTREAAEWLIANHPEPFLVFFGVKS